MRIFILDAQCQGLDFAMRCQDEGHSVRLWLPPGHAGEQSLIGKGMVERPIQWQPSMPWADLVVLTDNSMYQSELAPYLTGEYPVFGCNAACADLELNREKGQRALEECGIDTLPYDVFTDYDSAIAFVTKTNKRYVSKPWGGASDKSITYVAKSGKDMIFRLQKWKKELKLKDSFLLQEVADGIEMGCAGWFGPGGWCSPMEENWEFKKLMVDDLGPNTGEQGTVMRYVSRSKLFEEMLEPVTDLLHKLNYVGNIDMNCIIDGDKAWPLEFTCRLGWPAFHLQQALHKGDPAKWMLDLLNGRDSLEVSKEIGACVVLSHGSYPFGDMTKKHFEGYPIWGLSSKNYDSLHLCEVMEGVAPAIVGGKLRQVKQVCTAGDYVAVATSVGGTVREAVSPCYDTLAEIEGLHNPMWRTDIGDRLRSELPKLQENGYAVGMEY